MGYLWPTWEGQKGDWACLLCGKRTPNRIVRWWHTYHQQCRNVDRR